MSHEDLVYRENVIFVLYQSALNGEITQSEFFKVKEIVKRAKRVDLKTVMSKNCKHYEMPESLKKTINYLSAWETAPDAGGELESFIWLFED